MGKVNIVGILVIALGAFLVFLGITGRYTAFIGASSSSSSSSGASTGILPNQGSVPASNTAVTGIHFDVLNQDPVPTIGNLPPFNQNPTPQAQGIWQSILQGIGIGTHS